MYIRMSLTVHIFGFVGHKTCLLIHIENLVMAIEHFLLWLFSRLVSIIYCFCVTGTSEYPNLMDYYIYDMTLSHPLQL